MKIYIDGKQLDTYAKSMSVRKTNNLWKFGKAEFERTQTISVPATNNNKSLLDFADEFRTQSSVARGYVECLTELDGVVQSGRLYVSGYKGGEFSCILTFGKELQSLDVKLADAIQDSILPTYKLINEDSDFVGRNMYDKDGNTVNKVCVQTDYLLSLLQNSGISIIDYGALKMSMLGIASKYDANDITQYEKTRDDVIISRAGNSVDNTDPTTTDVIYTYSVENFWHFAEFAKTGTITYKIYTFKNLKPVIGSPYTNEYYGRISYIQFPYDIDIRFGAGCGDYAVGFLDESKASEFYYLPVTNWYGHYINVENSRVNDKDIGEVVSDDLSNTNLVIPANQKFVIFQFSDFAYNKELISGSFVTGYFTEGNVVSLSFNTPIAAPVFSKQFIPDVTIYQFLQTIAAYKQKLLYFDGSKYTLASVSDIKNGIEHACNITTGYEVSDKAFDFAQRNFVKYKSGGSSVEYDVNNVHLAESKDIQTIPFDCGNYNGGSNTVFRLSDSFPAIGYISTNTFRFSHVASIIGLKELLNSTRQVKIKLRMTYLDFDDVKELDCFRYKGALLQWVDLTWSDGWCTATLQTV